MRCLSRADSQVGPALVEGNPQSSLLPLPGPEETSPQMLEPEDSPTTPAVSLPARYKVKLGAVGAKETVRDDLGSRERDLGTALKWLRQEILLMKEQDQSLMQQFIDLRSSILQLRCLYQYQNSSRSSRNGSTASLNDSSRLLNIPLRVRADSDILDLASRTNALLALQTSPTFTRIKWRSDEYI